MLVLTLSTFCFFAVCQGWAKPWKVFCHTPYPALESTGIGLLTLGFIGAILNLTSLANHFNLQILWVIGLLFFVYDGLFRAQSKTIKFPPFNSSLLYLVLLLFSLFWIAQLHLISFVNPHDDLQTYIPRVARMFSTGTFARNPYEFMPLSDTGLQSFYQGLFLAFLPLDQIHGFDWIFCFLLSILLFIRIGCELELPMPVILLGILFSGCINPQLVNLAAGYSTIVYCLLFCLFFLNLKQEQKSLKDSIILLGLLLGNLILLKTSTIVFVFPMSLLLVKYFDNASARIRFICAIVLNLLLWIAVHFEKWNISLWSIPTAPENNSLNIFPSIREAFLNRPSLYGSERYDYLGILFFIVLCSIFSKINKKTKTQDPVFFLLTALTISTTITYFSLPMLTNSEAAMRYTAIFFAAISPVIFYLVSNLWIKNRAACKPIFHYLIILCLALVFSAFWIFSSSVSNRLHMIATRQTLIAFPVSGSDLEIQKQMLSAEKQLVIARIQSKIPAGEKLFALTGAPQLLDYSRNPIDSYHFDWSVTPWHLNSRSKQSFTEALKFNHTKYVLWEYQEKGIRDLPFFETALNYPNWLEYRTLHTNAVQVLSILTDLSKSEKIVFKDEHFVLIQL